MSDLDRTSSNPNHYNNNNAAAMSSTALMPAGVDSDTTSRPRNRRGPSAHTSDGNASAPRLIPGISPLPGRGVSPMPSTRLSTSKVARSGRTSPVNSSSFSKGLLEGSWAPSWTSVQDFASSFLSGGESGYNSESSRPNSRSGSKLRHKPSLWKTLGRGTSTDGRKLPEAWGPAPATDTNRPKADDIAAGSMAEREAALKAMKTASVLESHEGVNGGLDITGKYKRRNSDENPRATTSEPVIEEHLVYLHEVQPNDTYAGIILRYRCEGYALRKTNGLWSRDNIQIRKYLMIPVDACEIKGRPCDAPNFYNQKVDLLATTPQPESQIQSDATGSAQSQQPLHDDFFSSQNGKSQSLPEEERPWTHVRWVKIDSSQNPVEIVRVSRKAMGFFPPRRKKSIHTASTFSTPRQSLELSRGVTAVSSEPALDSPGQGSRRRPSSLGGRPNVGSLGTSPSVRSRGDSIGQVDGMPAWMRKPGGVGTMGRSVKAPGPAKDYFNTWANKRLPKGFNIDNMPSMSVMGSESAHWGFANKTDEDVPTGIVESPFEDGRDANLADPKQGIGLEQAAASIETWLRGAWAKKPSTPLLGSTKRPTEDLDLIELTDTNSDDGLPRTPLRMPEANLLNSGYFGTTSRDDGEGVLRGRSLGPAGAAKGKKSD